MGMIYDREELFFSRTSSNTSTRLLAAEPPLNTTTPFFGTTLTMIGFDMIGMKDGFEGVKDGQPPFNIYGISVIEAICHLPICTCSLARFNLPNKLRSWRSSDDTR